MHFKVLNLGHSITLSIWSLGKNQEKEKAPPSFKKGSKIFFFRPPVYLLKNEFKYIKVALCTVCKKLTDFSTVMYFITYFRFLFN